MRHAGTCVGLAIGALLLGGCGATAADGSTDRAGSTPPSTTASSTTASSPQRGAGESFSPSDGPQFPLTLRRVGGIAGFDDHIVLEANGRVRVDTRSVRGRICTLDVPRQRQLVSLLATLRLDLSTATLPAIETTAVDPESDPESDPITISVIDDQARAVDLSDPSLGEISGLVGALVGDVTLSVPATTRCSTPSPSTVAGASTP